MEMSETDASPSPYMASREMSMCLRETSVDEEFERRESSPSQAMSSSCDDNINEEYFQQHLQLEHHLLNHHGIPVTGGKQKQQQPHQDNASTSPVSPNGNSMTRSDITNYQDACSSPDDQLDDVVNSNEQLNGGDRLPAEYSDDDNLKTLGRKVYEFITENRLSGQSTATMDNGNMMCETMTTTRTTGSDAQTTITTTVNNGIIDGVSENRLNAQFDSSARRGYVSVNNANSEVTVIRCGSNSSNKVIGVYNNSKALKNDFCDDSWTDEEGEDPDYNYSLRRKRYFYCAQFFFCELK